MKRICHVSLYLSTVILIGVVVAVPVCAQAPTITTPSENSETAKPSSFPNDVSAVFKNSCMVCHGTGGRLLTLSVLNLSRWDEYNTDKKKKKATAICEAVTKGVMPPASHQRSNPASVLTPAQKELICTWSQTQGITR